MSFDEYSTNIAFYLTILFSFFLFSAILFSFLEDSIERIKNNLFRRLLQNLNVAVDIAVILSLGLAIVVVLISSIRTMVDPSLYLIWLPYIKTIASILFTLIVSCSLIGIALLKTDSLSKTVDKILMTTITVSITGCLVLVVTLLVLLISHITF